MTREECRQAIYSLASLVRRYGWEDLIEVQISPEAAEREDYDDTSARAFVANVSKVVGDLGYIEIKLMSKPEIESIAFKRDIYEDDPQADAVSSVRLHRLDGDEQMKRRAQIGRLKRDLTALRNQFSAR